MDPGAYWLDRFVDDVGLKKPEQIEKLFHSEPPLQRMIDMAHEAASSEVLPLSASDEWEVIGSRQMDLSGLLTCLDVKCLRNQVEDVFTKVWHYFDRIVVEGLSCTTLLRACPCDLRGHLRYQVTNQLLLLLYLRRIGALPYLRFVTKPSAFCETHYGENARVLGLPTALDDGMAQELILHLAAEGTLETIQAENGKWVLVYRHPDLEFQWLTFADSPDAVKIEDIARDEYIRYTTAAVADVALAREMATPLAATAVRILQLASRNQGGWPESTRSWEDTAMLNLRLPVLDGLSAADLLELRTDHRAEFTRFRAALRTAIREHAVGMEEERDPQQVARAVTKEFVQPALADIEARLEASRRALRRKSLQTAAVGGVMAGVGLLTAMPLLIGGGVAAGASALTHANTYADQRREIELSDSFFLWRVGHRHG